MAVEHKDKPKITIWDEGFRPVFEICPKNVNEPTLSVIEISKDGLERQTVGLQWFGQAHELPKGHQFLFELTLAKRLTFLELHPYHFRVPFLGQVKDWYDSAAVEDIAKDVTHGNKEGWVAWLVNGYSSMKYKNRLGDGLGPASFVVEVILLGDPNFGLITPEPFVNMKIWEKESDRFESRRLEKEEYEEKYKCRHAW